MAENGGTADSQLKLAQEGELDPLIKLIRHTSDSVRSLANKALNSLAKTEDGLTVKGGNGYSPLIELLRLQDQEVRSKAIWSIAILASYDENQEAIVEQVGWGLIIDLIQDDIIEVQCGGITLLGNLALLDSNKDQIIQKNGVDILLNLLMETRDIIVKRAIVTALSNIVDSDNAFDVFDDDSLMLFIALLEKTEDERLLSGVVHTLSNIANAEDAKFNRTIARKSLRRLIYLLDSPVDAIQKGAVMALNGISSTAACQSELFRQGAVKKMEQLLKRNGDDDELILGVVLCINNLSQNENNHKILREMGISKIIKAIFKNSSDKNIRGECSEAAMAIDEGVLSGKHKRRTGRVRSGIKDNVKRIIEVLIKDPRNQNRLRDSGVIPHLVSLIVQEQQDEELKGLALDALTMLAINNTRNQNDIAIPDRARAVSSLESIIQNNLAAPKIMVRAVRLVGALSWKNKLVQGLVAERKIIPFMVATLDTYDNNLKKASLTALACVAEDNVVNQQKISELDADRIFMRLILKETFPDSIVAAAAQAIAALAKENPRVQGSCSKCVQHLVTLLEEAVHVPHDNAVEDHIVQEQLCAALFELSRNHKSNKSIMWRSNIQKLLIEILYNAGASAYTHYNALALLWEFVKKSETKRESLASNPDLVRSLRPLTDSKDQMVKDAANLLKQQLGIK